jgi:membrane peptidoglycan carboxypeptidase
MAAKTYFQKRARDLTLPEAALLAGIPANPTAYDPAVNPKAARGRRATVLRIMLDEALITEEQYEEANAAPLPNPDRIGVPGSKTGPAPYFAEYVKQQLIEHYGSGKVFGGGLHVTTSIDLELQRLARVAVGKWLGPIPNGPSAALVAIDPRDGRVLAMYGGSSFKESQFNLAVQGERQSGSAFKPFVLAAALSAGISPSTVFQSKPTTISLGGELWSVSNYEGSYLGNIDLFEATTYSDNAAYAQLTALVGPAKVRDMAHLLGIKSPLDAYLSIGLGTEAVNPLEMARAYSTFANGGKRVDGRVLGDTPRAVLSVKTEGRVEENAPFPKPVFDSNDDAMLTSMLRSVVESGTGRRAELADGRPLAGKTGTTENYGDAWFVGYTPQLAVAVWVGYPNKLVPMKREYGGQPVAGGTFPALIFKTFTESALRYLKEPAESFPSPQYGYGVPVRMTFRDNEWRVDNGNCRRVREVIYFAGYEPDEKADCKPNEVDVPRVVGLTVEQAQARLASMPLKAEILTRPAKPGERVDRVVDQYPKSGTLSSWDTVRIVIPEAPATIPRLIGLSVTRAEQLLAGLGLVTVVEAAGEGTPGIVLAQKPRAGRAAIEGMKVRLLVARG